MVKKLFALASITALTGLVATTGVAGCSSTETIVQEAPDSGDKTSTTKRDAATSVPTDASKEDPEPESCYDEGTAIILNEKVTAEFPGGRCTSAQLDEVLEGCTGKSASNETCEAAIGTAPDCGECVFGPTTTKDTFDLPMAFPVGKFISVSPSLYACLAVELNKPECAMPMANGQVCLGTACQVCEDAEREACMDEASKGACSQIEFPKDCVDAFNTLKADSPELKACSGADFTATLKAISNRLCVQGAKKDAG